MLRYVIVRFVWIFIVLSIILSMNFVLVKLAPEYPPTEQNQAEIYYEQQFNRGYMTKYTENNIDAVRAMDNSELKEEGKVKFLNEKGIDQYTVYNPVPISDQYFIWAKGILTEWDWGRSTKVQFNIPVFEILKSRIPVTLRLNLIALFFYIPIGFGLGILAALRKNSITDNVISMSVMIFISIPSFVTMTFLLMIFGYGLEWVPTQFVSGQADFAKQVSSMILPVMGLSFGAIAGLTRFTRAELTEVLTSEFLLLARTKGLTKNQAVIRHAMRNSMVPLVPSIIGSFVSLLSGSVVIELIYGIPGTGRIFIRAITRGAYDFNLALGITAFYTIISLTAVLLVDLSYGIVDPRIRMGAKK
ncbi:ABC transporter permease [Mycoplasmatota bacterium]|nr:ABC transporter permease [Mycoplasmatota bacterium]